MKHNILTLCASRTCVLTSATQQAMEPSISHPEAKSHLVAVNTMVNPFNAVGYLEKINVNAMNQSFAKWEKLSAQTMFMNYHKI